MILGLRTWINSCQTVNLGRLISKQHTGIDSRKLSDSFIVLNMKTIDCKSHHNINKRATVWQFISKSLFQNNPLDNKITIHPHPHKINSRPKFATIRIPRKLMLPMWQKPITNFFNQLSLTIKNNNLYIRGFI